MSLLRDATQSSSPDADAARAAVAHVERAGDAVALAARFVPVVRRPDTGELPAEAAQDRSAQTITIAGGRGGVIARPIALDPDQVTNGRRWADDRKSDSIARAPDLAADLADRLHDNLRKWQSER